jgi:hypothetical protein
MFVWEDADGKHATNNPKEVPENILKQYDYKPEASVTEVVEKDNRGKSSEGIVFRGMKWGSSIRDYKDMVLVEDGEVKYYSKRNDNLTINESKLDKILYDFFSDKLMSIIIKFTGYGTFSNIHKAFKENYGTEYKPNQYMEKYRYCLQCESSASIEYSSITNKGTIYYMNSKISKEWDEYRNEKARKAKIDL